MNVQYREATKNDAYELSVLESKYFSFPHTEEQFKYEIDDKNHYILIVTLDDIIVGYAGLMYIIDESYITNIVVDESVRRNGIADNLMTCLYKKAISIDASFISLEVRKSNLAAICLYKKHCYVEKGIIPNYYSNPNDDALIMTLEVHN